MDKREVTTTCIHLTPGDTTPLGKGRVVITIWACWQFWCFMSNLEKGLMYILCFDDNREKNICSLQKIALSSASDEYQKVWNLFNRTLPFYFVQKIERVQNLALWEVYQWCVGGSLSVGW